MALSRALRQVAVAGGFQQLLHLLEVEALGQAFFLLGGADGGQRVGADGAAANQELVEAPQRRQLARRRALGVVLTVEIVQELADGERVALDVPLIGVLTRAGLASLADLAGQELAELDQVGAVALDGVVAEVLLELEVVEKLLDEGSEVFFQDR